MSHDGVSHDHRGRGPDEQVRALFHDLSNALTRILTTSEFIEQAAGDDAQALHDAQVVHAAALESRHIVEQLRERVVGTSPR